MPGLAISGLAIAGLAISRFSGNPLTATQQEALNAVRVPTATLSAPQSSCCFGHRARQSGSAIELLTRYQATASPQTRAGGVTNTLIYATAVSG